MRRTAIRMVECGHCRQIEALTRIGAPWRVTDFPSLVGVIDHPTEGIVLFDTGYDPAFLRATKPFPERLYRWATPVALPEGQTIVERLARSGRSSADVRHIVISHFHGDHVSGLHNFPNARLHCARAGLQDVRSKGRFARVRHGLLDAVIPQHIEKAAFFEDDDQVVLPAEFSPFGEGADVLGDGSLVAVELPGHCPGHWGMALKTEDGRCVLLVGDAAWSLTAIERDMPPPGITSGLLGDAHAARRTLGALHTMAGREGLSLIPSHCRRASADAGLIA